MTNNNKRLKIILAGPGAVGKTTFLYFIRTGKFYEGTPYTVGAEEMIYKLKYKGEKYVLRVIDIGGQVQFSHMRKDYYPEADAAILMFSLSFSKTLNDLKIFYDEITEICGDIPMVIAGNKADKWKKEELLESVIQERIKELRRDVPHFLISAKSGLNVGMVFPKLLEIIQ